MSTYGLQFAINRTFFGYGVDVYQKDPKGTISIAKNLEMQEMTEAEMCQISLAPLFTLNEESAKALMDSLWRCGIRPSNGEGSIGQIGAVKDHLADMQKIVFNTLLKETQCLHRPLERIFGGIAVRQSGLLYVRDNRSALPQGFD